MILNYCLPNNFDMPRFNYQRSFGLANIFLSTVLARITFTWQNAWPWKNRTLATHIKMERKSKLWTRVDRVFLAKKNKKTSQQLHFICNLNHYFAEQHWKYNFFHWLNQSYDFCTDRNGLWFPRWCYVAWGHHDNDYSKSKIWVMIPQMVLSDLKTSGLWFVCLTESYDDMIKPEQINIMIPKAHTTITRIVTGYSIPKFPVWIKVLFNVPCWLFVHLWFFFRLKYRIQGHLFTSHWITKVAIVLYFNLQKIYTCKTGDPIEVAQHFNRSGPALPPTSWIELKYLH